MVRIGTVWDRTTEVIAGRLGMLAWLAGLFLFAPSVLQAIMRLMAMGSASGGMRLLAGLVGLAVAVLAIWGTLAMTAMASDPAVDRHEAIAIGRRRLPAGIAVLLVVVVATFVVVIAPLAWLMAGSVDMARLEQGASPSFDPSRAAAAVPVLLALCAFMLWLSARLLPLFAVVTNERRGLGAFARAFALTHGSTMKLIGLILLYALVAIVLLTAVTWVLGSATQIAFGDEGRMWSVLVLAIVTGIVTAGLSVLQAAFSAQFYIAARERLDNA
ncbi:hypothetical protein F9288_20900 [Sphingomonas sp. CL5.1]|uniref:hypothetical protein n=1 Tax=Sphingomonas sp. CL5.1 TaxID=2653203 RepID=UPI0015822B2C|nr:hypothetical protein [Sphingomonas sp. CL5.1]QKS01800.1 hypothetical protein F9288_20900 [Sphingomonas sp. CL5.1]